MTKQIFTDDFVFLMLLQDTDNDGFHRMTKTDIPPKLFNNNDGITRRLNNHEFVSTCYLIRNCKQVFST